MSSKVDMGWINGCWALVSPFIFLLWKGKGKNKKGARADLNCILVRKVHKVRTHFVYEVIKAKRKVRDRREYKKMRKHSLYCYYAMYCSIVSRWIWNEVCFRSYKFCVIVMCLFVMFPYDKFLYLHGWHTCLCLPCCYVP